MEQLQEQQEVKLISMDMIQSQQVEYSSGIRTFLWKNNNRTG